MSTCHALTLVGGRCRALATHHAVLGCVHEHFREGDLCVNHAEVSGLAECLACYEGLCSHICKLSLIKSELLS